MIITVLCDVAAVAVIVGMLFNDKIEAAIRRLARWLRPGHSPAAAGSAAPVDPVAAERVDLTLVDAVDTSMAGFHEDYDVYRLAARLPGEHDYRRDRAAGGYR